MADTIKRFKNLAPEDVFKGLSKSFSTQQTAYGDVAAGGSEALTWHLVERSGAAWNTDDLKNLFFSFGIAREDDEDWDRVFGAVDWYNATRMLFAHIPASGCGSYIDGATVEVNVPTGTTATSFIKFFGASFNGYPDPETGYAVSATYDDSVYGGASVYLFPNTIGANSLAEDSHGEHPYTGNVDGSPHSNAGLGAWDGANASNDTFYPHLRATQWIRNPDDGRDVPYGLALLEKGIFVFFDFPGRDDWISTWSGYTLWTEQTTTIFGAVTTTGGTVDANSNADNARLIQFTGTNADVSARVIYRTVTEDYKMVYFCHAGQSEFNSTSNHTYNSRKSFYRPDEADSVYVTEVGLYDDEGDLLAYGKLSEPVEKNKLETLTLKVELQVG